jgi:hypothetical protein
MIGFGVQYSAIKTFDSIGRILFEAYKLRVLSDGGVVENRSCIIKNLNRIK